MTKPSNPDYHWTAAQMRAFLEVLAETGLIGEACDSVNKSRRSAYNLRFRDQGRAFALGWEAALLVARATLADMLMERAIKGYSIKTRRDPETHETETVRIDNRCGMGMLRRLDAMTGWGVAPQAGSDAALARIIAQDFWRFLELVEAGGEGSEAALFVAARTAAAAPDIVSGCELADDEVEKEEEILSTKEQAERMHVWWSELHNEFLTNYPPPEIFDGFENGDFGSPDYHRTLSPQEERCQWEIGMLLAEPLRREGCIARDRWFSFPDRLRPVIEKVIEAAAA
jgi:hypothetical protein